MHTKSSELHAPAAQVLAERSAAHAVAAIVGCDHRTALRALADVDSIRPLRLREQLRAEIARLRLERRERLAG